jgi:Zn-finger nucleic acid-binding protein
MRCPVCAVDMFVLEFERVEIDYCHRCGGVWLDSGELELIGGRAGALKGHLLEALDSARAGGKRGKRPCPVCSRKMRLVETQTSPPIVVDRCPGQHGLWFDRGELSAVVRAAGANQDNVLARFFTELDGPQSPKVEGD